MVRRNKTNYVIQSVAHALDVLEQFFGEVDELGVTELSKRLKLHKNNVFRLLATLEAPLLALDSVDGLAHFTDWSIAHIHLLALGWTGMAAGQPRRG